MKGGYLAHRFRGDERVLAWFTRVSRLFPRDVSLRPATKAAVEWFSHHRTIVSVYRMTVGRLSDSQPLFYNKAMA